MVIRVVVTRIVISNRNVVGRVLVMFGIIIIVVVVVVVVVTEVTSRGCVLGYWHTTTFIPACTQTTCRDISRVGRPWWGVAVSVIIIFRSSIHCSRRSRSMSCRSHRRSRCVVDVSCVGKREWWLLGVGRPEISMRSCVVCILMMIIMSMSTIVSIIAHTETTTVHRKEGT